MLINSRCWLRICLTMCVKDIKIIGTEYTSSKSSEEKLIEDKQNAIN